MDPDTWKTWRVSTLRETARIIQVIQYNDGYVAGMKACRRLRYSIMLDLQERMYVCMYVWMDGWMDGWVGGSVFSPSRVRAIFDLFLSGMNAILWLNNFLLQGFVWNLGLSAYCDRLTLLCNSRIWIPTFLTQRFFLIHQRRPSLGNG
jgi:hypothetical protein